MCPSAVRIEKVTGRQEIKQFVLFPYELYRHDPYWVSPLIGDRMHHFDPHHNPFFEHATTQLFRAVRDGEIVGIIVATDDQAHVDTWNESVGFWGEFECIEDYSVAQALFDAARDWLAARGRQVMRGPMNLNINDECGLLVDGFNGSPVVMMTYNPRYYVDFCDRYGFQKAKDLYAFKLEIAKYGADLQNLPPRVKRVAQIAQERYGVRIRQVDMAHLDKDVELIRPIHREAWSKNWGAVPMTDAEYTYLAAALKQVLDPELTYLAFIGDEAVGCMITLPDFCQVAKKLNGRLFPLGWLKFLYYRKKIDGIRILIMGVKEEHRLKGVESLFYQEGCRVAIRKGYKWAEESWLLEDNYKVIRGVESMGGTRYRTYRIYDVPTAAQPEPSR
jgi:GNAT superfamily N-acetyltransferase